VPAVRQRPSGFGVTSSSTRWRISVERRLSPPEEFLCGRVPLTRGGARLRQGYGGQPPLEKAGLPTVARRTKRLCRAEVGAEGGNRQV
jgi:hypothetical protein